MSEKIFQASSSKEEPSDLEANNLVEADETHFSSAPSPAASSESEESFPDRRGFFTGHRIPVELFGEKTKCEIIMCFGQGQTHTFFHFRARLLQDDEDEEASPSRTYVDSSAFRSAPLISDVMQPPSKEPEFPQPSEVRL